MGLLNFLNTAFEGSTGNTTKIYSMLSTNTNSNSLTPNNTLTDTSSQVQTELYKFLNNYNFVNKILKRFTSTISDVISKSSLTITIKGEKKKYEKLSKECTDLLSDMQFFNTMKVDLRDLLYWGNYGYKVDFTETRLKRLDSGIDVLTEDTYCTDRKLIIDNWVDKDERFKNKSYKYSLLPIQFNPTKLRTITELDAYLEFESKKQGKAPANLEQLRKNYLKEHPNSDKVVKHTIYRGRGVLDTEMNNLLVLYIKELLYDLMGLKDTMRPDILTARVMDDKTNESDITTAINDIEALVNMGSASSQEPGTQSFLSIQNLLAGVQSYLQNGIKVVPEINNFTSISTLNLPDLIGKRNQLKNEIEELRQRILSNIGLEEQPARSNWDALQSNSEFLTVTESFVTCISMLARDIIYEYLCFEHKDEKISYDDIQLDLDTTDIIFNQYSLTRARVLSEKVDSISRILRSADDFSMNQYVDQKQAAKYIMKLVTDLDPTAISFIKDVPQEPSPDSDIESVDEEMNMSEV